MYRDIWITNAFSLPSVYLNAFLYFVFEIGKICITFEIRENILEHKVCKANIISLVIYLFICHLLHTIKWHILLQDLA
jgi:hypothetical protein